MLKKLLVTSLALASLCGVATAGNVLVQNANFGTGAIRPVTTGAGAILPAGSGYVGVGTFSISDAEIQGGADLAAAFTEFGSGTIGQGANNIDGLFIVDTSQALAAGDAFVGNAIYAAIGDGADLASSSGLLVFKQPSTNDQPSFGADAPVFSATLNLLEASEADILVGSIGGATSVSVGGNTIPADSSLQLIPEPSTGLLALVGAMALGLRRRR